MKRRLQELDFYDFLTGLISFPTFYQILQYAILEADRFNHSLALIYIDVDNFVIINDTFGHLGGDEVLIEISQRLKKILPVDSIISRIGEDDFIILVSDDDIKTYTMNLAKEIKTQLKKPFPLVVDKLYLTVSIGVLCFHHLDINIDQVLECAKEAISRAKRKGGDSIELIEVN